MRMMTGKKTTPAQTQICANISKEAHASRQNPACGRTGAWGGHPSVLKGQRAEENQVSSTSMAGPSGLGGRPKYVVVLDRQPNAEGEIRMMSTSNTVASEGSTIALVHSIMGRGKHRKKWQRRMNPLNANESASTVALCVVPCAACGVR